MIFFNMQADEQGQVFSFNRNNSLELKFDSYHGFPKLSNFLAPINKDYFEEGEFA